MHSVRRVRVYDGGKWMFIHDEHNATATGLKGWQRELVAIRGTRPDGLTSFAEAAPLIAPLHQYDQQYKIELVVVYCCFVTLLCSAVVVALFLRDSAGKIPINANAGSQGQTSQATGLFFALCTMFSFAIGIAVCLQSKAVVVMNGRSEHPLLHALTLTFTIHLLSAVPLSAASECVGGETKWPPSWAWFAGACSVLSYMQVISNGAYGLAITLGALLSGSLSAAFVIDLMQSPKRDVQRPLGMALVICGAFLLYSSSKNDRAFKPHRPLESMSLVLTAVGGAGFACQALCKQQLCKCLGNPFRAATVSVLVTSLCWTPIVFTVGEPLRLDMKDAWLLVYCVACFFTYSASMAKLPELISFSTTFTMKVCGQLFCAVFLDAKESNNLASIWESHYRLPGVALVVFGTALSQYHGASTKAVRGSGSSFLPKFDGGEGVLRVVGKTRFSRSSSTDGDSESD